MGFVGSVESFDDLFIEAELSGVFVEVLEAYNLSMGYFGEGISVSIDEVDTCSIRRVTISD